MTYGQRRKLPVRRKGYNQKLTIMAKRRCVLHIRTGEHEDGTLGEIFVDVDNRTDATTRAMVNMWCVAVSLALQHGCPLETLTELYVFTKFDPSGMVRDHDKIAMCTSITDAVFRDLAIHYLGRSDLGQKGA